MSPQRLKNIAALAAAACCAFTAPAGAASLTYNGGTNTSGAWLNGGSGWLEGVTGTNWNNAAPDAAIFGGVLPANVNIEGGVTVGSVSVTSGTYTMGGTGTLTLSGTTWDVASGLTNTVSTALAGTTGIIKTNSGILLMSGANKSYTGTTVINGGAIQITNAVGGSLGSSSSGAITLNGGALYTQFVTNNTAVNYAIAVTNSGELRNLGTDSQRFTFVSSKISGSGVLTLAFGTNDTRFVMGTTTQSGFSGKWVINSGGNVNRFLDVDGADTFGNVTGDDAITLLNSGTILFRSTRTYGTNSSGTFGITVGSGGGSIATGGSQTVTMAAKISGAATNALRLDLGNSTSILVLSNTANSWLGTTTLTNQGTLRLGASGVIADSGGTLDMASSTTKFDLNGFSEAIGGLSGNGVIDNKLASTASVLTVGGNNESTTFSGVMSNSGSGATLALVKTGTGTLTLSGSNAYSGTTTISAGTLQIGSGGTSGSIGSTSGVTNNATLAYNRSDNITASYAISGTGALTKSGAGTLTLSGANSYSGTTTISAGVLEITNGSAIADTGVVTLSNASGAGLAVNTSETIGSLRNGGATGGNVSIASGQTLTVVETGGQAFAGAITNSGSLAKSGAGTLTLSSASSSYSGGTTVRGGRLVASNANALGSGNILLQADSTSRATLVLNNITMTGKTLTMDSTTNRAILLSGSSGGATWNGDIVLIGGASANGTTELANDTGNGPLTLAGTITGSIAGGALTLRGAGATTTNVLSATVSIGSTSLAKTDDSTWQITSSGNTWSGTTISAGSLSVGNGGATGELGAGGITNNATLVVNRTGAINLTNTISGSGALVKTAAGTLTLSGNNTYGGTTTISSGTLQIGNGTDAGSIGSTSAITNNGALVYNVGSGTRTNGAAISGNGTLTQSSSDGTLKLTGSNSYTGATIISAGTLQIGDGGTTGSIGFTSGVNNSSTLAYNRSDNLTATYAISGGGNVTKSGAGTLTLSGANSYSGGTLLSAGALKGDATSLQGAITNNSTAIFDTSTNGAYAGVMSGTGALAKSGAGTLTLTATNTYNGATTVETGKLVVNGSIASSAVTVQSNAMLGGAGTVGATVVNSGATIAPGNSPGALTINGDLTWNNGGGYDWEVFRLPGEGTAGTDWDLLSVTGSLNLTNLTGAPLFNINLYSLNATNSAGPLANWSNTGTYAWKILAASNAISTNYISPAYFGINTTQFAAHNDISGGLFAIELRDNDKGLYLTYSSGAPVPEPGTWAAAALLAGGAAFVRWRRKRGAQDEQPD